MCAAIINTTEADDIRAHLRPLRLPGQVKLHWSDEQDRRRRLIVEAVADVEAMQVLITHRSAPNRKTERYRRKCLERLYFELEDMGVSALTLESRQMAQNRMDIAHIVSLRNRGIATGLEVSHVRGADDPLLWIPDIILGALNTAHLGETRYWNALRDQVVLEKATPGSL